MNKFYDNFNHNQLKQIELGLREELDISIYAKPEFSYQQMAEIRVGLEKGLDASIYAKSELSCCEIDSMRTILLELRNISRKNLDKFLDIIYNKEKSKGD